MKKMIFAALLLSGLGIQAQAQTQKYFTRDGKIQFSASTPMEKIDATSKGTTAVVDAASGAIEFAVLVKGFLFERALMQEHFNENYLESDKFPKATFKGKIQESTSVKWTKDGDYPVKVKGTLTIHGVSREVTTEARISVKGGKILATTKFDVAVADYNIKIPSVVADKVARIVTITVEAGLSELKK